MPRHEPPLRQLAVSLVVDRLRVVVPPAALVALAVILVPSSIALFREPAPTPAGAVAPQAWTTDAPHGLVLSTVLHVLPHPGPNQKRAEDCDADQAQVPINGGCWVETKKPPPCPRGKLWEHEGKCWLPVAYAARVPTSGEPRPLTVADP